MWPGGAYTITFCVCLDTKRSHAIFTSNRDTNAIEV